MTNLEMNEVDTSSNLDSNERVIYLKSLGYRFDNWEGYAMAELNELGASIEKAA